MSVNHQPESCQRPGCAFSRAYRLHPSGGYRRQRHCSPECYVWSRRAFGASAAGNVTEASELMELVKLLDARQDPRERVPDVFTEFRP